MAVHNLRKTVQEVGFTVPTGTYWHMFVNDAAVDVLPNIFLVSLDLSPSFASAKNTNTFNDAVQLEGQATEIESVEINDRQTIDRLRRIFARDPARTREMQLIFSGARRVDYSIERVNDGDAYVLETRHIPRRG